MNESVIKCSRFFKTLLHLSEKQTSQYSPQSVKEVRQLVQGVVYGAFSPEEFTVKLQKALNSQAQQNLLPFLQRTLPELREALEHGQHVIEGIGTPEEFWKDFAAEEDNSAPSTGQFPAISSPKNSLLTANKPNSYSGIANNSDTTIPSTNIKDKDESQPQPTKLITQPIATISTPMIISTAAITTQIPVAYHPTTTTTTTTMATIATTMTTPASSLSSATTTSALNIPGSSAANVIVGPVMPANFLRTFLDPQTILNRIRAKMPDCEAIDAEALVLISNAAENKLRELAAKLLVVAEHRLEPLRLNSHYRQLDDPRKQLQCIEEVERRVFERRESLEREALLKISKSKGKDKDTIERVRQIQRADKEAALNREANEAALSALGGMRGTKRPASGVSFQQPLNSRLTIQTHKPRMKRIVTRDLAFVLSKDAYGSSTNLYYKLCYSDENKNFN